MSKNENDSAEVMSGKVILMIEDDPYLREYYKRLLEREGAKILIAEDGAEGFDMTVDEKPDCILLDIMLPKKTGIEFLEQLKKDKVKHGPILCLTDLDQSTVEEKAMTLGAVDYIHKCETNGPELKRRIEKALAKINDE